MRSKAASSTEQRSTARGCLLTKGQLRDALGFNSTRMVDELMRKRKIPYLKLGHRTVRFNLERVLAALGKLEICEVGRPKPLPSSNAACSTHR